MTVSSNPSNDIQAYIDAMMAKYQSAMKLIQDMEKWEKQAAHDQTALQTQIYDHHQTNLGLFSTPGYYTTNYTLQSQLQNDYNSCEGHIATDKAQVQALYPNDPGVTSLLNQLSAYLNALGNLNNLDEGDNPLANQGDVNQGLQGTLLEDIADIQKYISAMFAALQEQIEGDTYQGIISNDKSGSLTEAQLAEYSSDMVQARTAEQTNVLQLVGQMCDDKVKYHKQGDDAKADRSNYHWWDDLGSFFGGSGETHEAIDDAEMDNANKMQNMLSAAIKLLAPLAGGLAPELMQLQIVIQEVIKQALAIWAGPGTPVEKGVKLLALAMFVSGFITEVKQEAETEKANNEAMMQKANQDAAQMNMDDSNMNATIQANQKKYQDIMGDVLFASKLVLGVIFTLMAPGWGTALIALALTVADCTGGPNGESLMDKATTALGNAMGSQVGADVVVGTAEILVAGGAMAIEKGIAKWTAKAIVAIAVETGETAAKDAVETSAKKAADAAAEAAVNAGQSVPANGIQNATAVVETTVKKAAEAAAIKTYQSFYQQSFGSLLAMAMKGTLKSSAKEAVMAAAKEAAVSAAQDSRIIAEIAASKGTTAVVAVQDAIKDIDTVAARAANEAVATQTGKTLAQVVAEDNPSRLKTGAKFTLYVAAALGTTNTYFDMAQAWAKKGKDGQADQALLTALSAIQQILQVMAGMALCANGGGTFSNTLAWQRIANVLGMGAQSMSAAGSYGQYEIYETQAQATEGLSFSGSLSEIFQQMNQQQQQDSNLERDRSIKDVQQNLQTDSSMAAHLFDGEMRGIQVLSQAI